MEARGRETERGILLLGRFCLWGDSPAEPSLCKKHFKRQGVRSTRPKMSISVARVSDAWLPGRTTVKTPGSAKFTTVDPARLPQMRPASTTAAQRDQSCRNSSGCVVLAAPLKLALVSASARPCCRHRLRMKSLSGTRRPAHAQAGLPLSAVPSKLQQCGSPACVHEVHKCTAMDGQR